jgi:hypothetical protein
MNQSRALAVSFAACGLLVGPSAVAQLSAYGFKSGKVPLGRIFHYEKSNLDGSHLARISVYVAAVDRMEALKWDQGSDQATLVQAQMDWSKFSVRRFEAWHLSRMSAPEQRVTADVNGDVLSMSLMDHPVMIEHWPWHSYDFDFTSLNFTLPHLRNSRGDLLFWRTDFVYSTPPAVAEIGEMHLRFESAEYRAGKAVWRYSIGGAGLQNTTGTWWADRRTGLLVEYEIPVGDEPGYDNVRLKFLSAQRMSPRRWEGFKRAAVGAE